MKNVTLLRALNISQGITGLLALVTMLSFMRANEPVWNWPHLFAWLVLTLVLLTSYVSTAPAWDMPSIEFKLFPGAYGISDRAKPAQ